MVERSKRETLRRGNFLFVDIAVGFAPAIFPDLLHGAKVPGNSFRYVECL
jgi:hypothetical protein